MKKIEGNIIDIKNQKIFKGVISFTDKVVKIDQKENIQSNSYILPGFVDAHVHIESTLLTPFEYAKMALVHGVVASVTDPHEIANVMGVAGIRFMIENSQKSPMKIYTGAPSCVPATPFETNGKIITEKEIEILFKNKECSHLSEVMNFPGVLNKDESVLNKLSVAKKFNKPIDGHCPKLRGEQLKIYQNAGIQTDHECTSLEEALEKLQAGMKILIRKSTASNDFENLKSLVQTHSGKVMLCCDDIYAQTLQKGYINEMVKQLLQEGFNLFHVLKASSETAIHHYGLDVGLLQQGDSADFIVVDNLENLSILNIFINGEPIERIQEKKIFLENHKINLFFKNEINNKDIQIERTGNILKVIQIYENSLITGKNEWILKETNEKFLHSDTNNDILKIVVVNRYKKAKPAVGFVKGFGLKRGALASSVAHDSHNIIVVGVNDNDIIRAIRKIQEIKGGFVAINECDECVLPLPIGGLMSDQSCTTVTENYHQLKNFVQKMGTCLNDPFISLSFMALLVIPSLKIGDRGLFDVENFSFTSLQE